MTTTDRSPVRLTTPGAVQTVEVEGARIRVRCSGPADATPVLLLHGIGRSLEDWDEQHARLAPGRRVISPDLAGFGLSDALPGPVTLAAFARGVLGVLDAVGESRAVHVVGNSLGGAVAMQVAALAPARVRSLTLVDAAGFSREVTASLKVVGIPVLGRRLLARSSDAESVRKVERAIFVDRDVITPERLAHAQDVARRPQYARVFAATARHLGTVRGVRAGWRRRLLAQVAALDVPTLVVWGTKDLILPVAGLQAAAHAFPHARTHRFEGVGHMPQIERPDDFSRIVSWFLADVENAVA